MNKILKYLAVILLIPVSVFVILIIYATLSDYHPANREVIKVLSATTPVISDSTVLNIMIWNIGYAGLDKGMDFFYDGGKRVRTARDQEKLNFELIRSFLQKNDSADMILLQEVDMRSRRSYKQDQVKSLRNNMTEYETFFGKNYDVFFVPVPFNDPMGSVKSGLISMSRLSPVAVERYSFPGQYAWPKRLFMLDRCFMVMRFPVSNGKELMVINTHNEAYDDGSIRDQQMAYLKDFLITEYNKGNYVIVGGDWNQCPPDLNPHFKGEAFDSINNKGINNKYLPEGWQWIFDSSMPTNRRVDIPYTRGTTLTTLIDFYLLSPNIKPLNIQTTDLGFENSDHQPVSIKIVLQK